MTTPDIVPTCWDQFEMSKARPLKLDKSFFGKAGSIVVAAKRTMTNPFDALGMEAGGLYDAFGMRELGLRHFDMWAVSAARAGVRLRNDQGTPGRYVVQYPGDTAGGYRNGVWNLCEEDWDAVLIPVSRAWCETEPGKWKGDIAAGDLLESVLENSNLNIGTPYTGNIGNYLVH